MGCTSPSGYKFEKMPAKMENNIEKRGLNMKLDVESTKVQTAQNELMQTYKTARKESIYQQQKVEKGTNKCASYSSEQQKVQLIDNRLSQLPFSDIHNSFNTQSMAQTLDNAFFKTLQTQVNPFDRRYTIKQTFIYPYNCIGMLFYCVQTGEQKKNREYFYFTAFLVTPNIIMTSANALIRYNKENVITPLRFLIRQAEKQTLQNIFSKAKNIKKIFKPEMPHIRNNDNLKNCFCLLQLQTKIERERYLPLGYQFKRQAEVQVFGFPMSNLIVESERGDRQNLYGMKGEAKITSKFIQYDIDTSSGQQGAPVMISPIEGEYYVIGIHGGYVEKQEQFQKNTNILDMLELNSNIIKREVKVNIGTHITKQTLIQLKLWSQELVGIKEIEIIDCQNLIQTTWKPQKSLKNIENTFKKDIKTVQISSFEAKMLRYIEKAEEYYSKWQPHQSIKYCEKALRYLNDENQYFSFKVYFILGMNYRLLLQLQTALLYLQRSLQLLEKLQNKAIQHYILQVDLYSNISITYLQKNDHDGAQKFLRRAEKVVKKFNLFQHNAYIGILITKGIMAKQMKSYQAALKKFEEALAIYNKVKSNMRVVERQRLVTILQKIADCHYSLQNLREWATTGLQCISELQDVHVISRIFQIQWFQTFLTALSKQKANLSAEQEFKVARILSHLLEKSIQKTTEKYKKDFLSSLRLLKKGCIGNFRI